MKLTAFMTSTTARMVMIKDWVGDSTLIPSPGPTGREMICTPDQARNPAIMSWPASFVIQSRSRKSSTTPMASMMRAAAAMAMTGQGSAKIG